MRLWVGLLVGALAIVLVGTAVYPTIVPPPKPVPAMRATCLDSMKQTALAMTMYASDENDRFPFRDTWMDALYPYTKNAFVFHCPSEKGRWGYAFNGALDHVDIAKLASVGDVPVVYDSINPIKNASDLFTSLPAVPRHGRNTVSYADGHAAAVAP